MDYNYEKHSATFSISILIFGRTFIYTEQQAYSKFWGQTILIPYKYTFCQNLLHCIYTWIYNKSFEYKSIRKFKLTLKVSTMPRQSVVKDITTVRMTTPIVTPRCRHVGEGSWEGKNAFSMTCGIKHYHL